MSTEPDATASNTSSGGTRAPGSKNLIFMLPPEVVSTLSMKASIEGPRIGMVAANELAIFQRTGSPRPLSAAGADVATSPPLGACGASAGRSVRP